MGAETLNSLSGSSSITCTVGFPSRTCDRSPPSCSSTWPGCRGGPAGGLPGGANGSTCGGGTGGDMVLPPPHAQHIVIEMKPGISKVPHV
eukprot:scaffold54347_cov66-Phaeocystis_antarctica.AAC.1